MKKRITSKQYLTMCLGECFGTFLPACETDQVDKNIALAKELYITSTPTLIMPDGHVFPGYKKDLRYSSRFQRFLLVRHLQIELRILLLHNKHQGLRV